MRGYITNLAVILRKAQGVIDAETNQPIDIGGEVLAIRQEGDALNARIAELEKRNHEMEGWGDREHRAKNEALDRIAEFETALDSGMVVNWMGVYEKERGIRDTVALCLERALDVERDELKAKVAAIN